MISYAPNKKTALILLSTMHHDTAVSSDVDKKPDVVFHYNETKGGVDHMNQMVRAYSCERKTNRWPMTFFSNMLDVAEIAAFVIWLAENPNWTDGTLHRRRLLLQELGRSLVEAHLNHWCQNPNSMQYNDVKLAIQAIDLSITSSMVDAASISLGKKCCQLFPRALDRKVAAHCAHCRIPCCSNHRKTVCQTCWIKLKLKCVDAHYKHTNTQKKH